MKRFAFAIGVLALITGCSNNDSTPRFLKNSKNIATNKLHIHARADVHTHLGEQGEAHETHTTIEVEMYGFDSDGFYYNVELAETDQLTATQNGVTLPLNPLALPSEAHKLAIIYTEDFETTAAAALYTVSLNRDSDASAHNVDVSLLEETALSVLPTEQTVALSDTITVEWTPIEEYEYKLSFQLRCATTDGEYRSSRVKFPNGSVTSISSPFTFNPSNFFNSPSASDYTECALHSSLLSYSEQEAPTDSAFANTVIYATRQQHIEKSVTLEPEA